MIKIKRGKVVKAFESTLVRWKRIRKFVEDGSYETAYNYIAGYNCHICRMFRVCEDCPATKDDNRRWLGCVTTFHSVIDEIQFLINHPVQTNEIALKEIDVIINWLEKKLKEYKKMRRKEITFGE